MAYEDFKKLTRRAASNKIMHDKAFNIAKNPKPDGYQKGLSSMIYKFLDKEAFDGAIKNKNMSSKESTKKLHKPVITKFIEIKEHSSFIDNTWGGDLAHLQWITIFDKGIRF